MVKLLLNYSVTKLPIKRQEINKLVFNGVTTQKQFSDVFKSARKLLNEVSGVKMRVFCVTNLDYICRSMD